MKIFISSSPSNNHFTADGADMFLKLHMILQ